MTCEVSVKDSCCEGEARELFHLRARQAGVLRIVLAINLTMFFVESSAGIFASSTGLLSDSLDMLGDAFVYAFTLYILALGRTWRAIAALIKGVLMVLLALGVLVEAVSNAHSPEMPIAQTMAVFSGLALIANALCFGMLYRHRSDDVNLRSTWLCTRNDLVANVAVLIAAGLVDQTATVWPDLIVGLAIVLLFLRTAITVIREAIGELRSSASVSSAVVLD